MNHETGTIHQDPPPKLDNPLYDIRLEMWRRGGEFVRSLSQTLGAADMENKGRLIAAFPEIMQTYDGYASQVKQAQSDFLNRNEDDNE